MDILSPKQAIKLLKRYGAKMESGKFSDSFYFSKGQVLLRQFKKVNWVYKIIFYSKNYLNCVEIYYENGHVPTKFDFDSTEIQWEQAFKMMTFIDPKRFRSSIELREVN